jgi:phosphoglycerate dehydrogenase-like enzyme
MLRHVLFHYQASPALARRLGALAAADGLAVEVVAPGDDAALAAALPRAEVVWHVLEAVTAATIAAAPRLELIQKIGVGVNTIDLDAAKARGIAVCNMPGTNSRAVAELTLALLLACLRRVPALDAATRAGLGWDRPADEMDRFGEVGGRTVGLVGYGAVPRLLAPVLRAMGAEVSTGRGRRTPRLPTLGGRCPISWRPATSSRSTSRSCPKPSG